MVAPRANRIQIGLQLRVAQPRGHNFPRELRVPVRVQHIDHHHADAHRVHAAPRLRAIAEQAELRRQRGPVFRIEVLGDEQVHAACVIVQPRAVFRGQIRVDAPGCIPKLQHPLRLVVPHHRRAHDLRQLAVGVATEGVHLPQPVLRGHVSLSHEQIILTGSLDVGHAVGVAADEHGRREPGEMHISIQHRQRGPGSRAQPQHARARSDQQQSQQSAHGPEENSRPAAFTATRNRRNGRRGRLISYFCVGHRFSTG